jgi:hypothetical protein
MSLLNDLTAWLDDNPPADMPYFPGAAATAPFGLRRTKAELLKASPAHLGVDRAGGSQFIMPFDGSLYWRPVGGVAGSVLSLNPHGLTMEIQVFHTRNGGHVTEIHARSSKGEALPVTPSNLGLSIPAGDGDGTHTHTEIMFPYDREFHAWLRGQSTSIITKGAVNADYVIAHCRRHNLSAPLMLDKLREQIDQWNLEELTDRYAVRDAMPEYRWPEWGRGRTIHVDSMWLLKI